MSEAWTEETVLAALRRWADVYGEVPTHNALDPAESRKLAAKAQALAERHLENVRRFESGRWPSPHTIRRLFGSFVDAMAAAGFPVRGQGRTPRAVRSALDAFSGTAPREAPSAQALALRVREVARAQQSGDQLVLRAALHDLAALAVAWMDQIDSEHAEAA